VNKDTRRACGVTDSALAQPFHYIHKGYAAILFLRLELKIQDGFLAGIENAERSGGRGGVAGASVDLIIDIGFQAVEVIRSLGLGDEGPNLQSAHILELNDGTDGRHIIDAGDRTHEGAGIGFLATLFPSLFLNERVLR
jgi:hypothetical protein